MKGFCFWKPLSLVSEKSSETENKEAINSIYVAFELHVFTSGPENVISLTCLLN